MAYNSIKAKKDKNVRGRGEGVDFCAQRSFIIKAADNGP